MTNDPAETTETVEAVEAVEAAKNIANIASTETTENTGTAHLDAADRPAITPCLWFDGVGLDAAEFYVSLFPESHIDGVTPGPDGTPLMITFTLMGRPFQALNGGPQFRFTEAVSLVVPCDGQDDVDRYWASLVDGGEESQCGWLKDRFGLSWQVVPNQLGELLGDPDPERAGRAAAAMMQMRKIDLAVMRAAADGASA